MDLYFIQMSNFILQSANGEDDKSEFLNQHGFLPKIWSKTYTVESLPKYVTTASDISDKALETYKMKSVRGVQIRCMFHGYSRFLIAMP